MEAMAICIEASTFLRRVLAGVDLMPQCVVPSKRHVFYVPLDVLARGLLFPQYERVVAALQLDTEVGLYSRARPLRGGSTVAPAVAVKAEPGSADVRSSQPLDLWSAFEDFAESQPGKPA